MTNDPKKDTPENTEYVFICLIGALENTEYVLLDPIVEPEKTSNMQGF